jgi:hypothetical protein
MIAENLLTRLEGVRERGDGRWVARCPAHHDKAPSLSVQDVGDKVLLCCFSGCETAAVLDAVGLTWSELFEPKPHHEAPRAAKARPFSDRDLLTLLTEEGMVAVLGCITTVASGQPLSSADLARLELARGRIERVLELAS